MLHEEKLRSMKLDWINIEKPDQARLEELQKQYKFHDLDLEDCLSNTETPKIEEYKNYVFVVFHFPLKDARTGAISIHSLNVFIGNHFLITLSNGRLKKIDEFFHHLKEHSNERRTHFKRGSGYLLYLMISDLFEIYNPYISQLSRSIREIEKEIFEGKIMKDRLFDIMRAKRQIITLKRALIPHSSLIHTLEHLHKRFINKQLELYFDDIADKITRGESTLKSMDEMIDTLHNANESLTSHNTNRVMKILTIFSVTMLPLTFLTGLYGMNVKLPLSGNPQAFGILMLVMLGIFVLSLVFFRIRRYL
jgi:magnesium transporter